MIQRYDTTQQKRVDASIIRRYDGSKWVDVQFVRRYDTATRQWVDVVFGLTEFDEVDYNNYFSQQTGNKIVGHDDGTIEVVLGESATVSFCIDGQITDAIIEGDVVYGPSETYEASGYGGTGNYSHRFCQWAVTGWTYNNLGTLVFQKRVTLSDGTSYEGQETTSKIGFSSVFEGTYDRINIVCSYSVPFSDVTECGKVTTTASLKVNGKKYTADVNIVV